MGGGGGDAKARRLEDEVRSLKKSDAAKAAEIERLEKQVAAGRDAVVGSAEHSNEVRLPRLRGPSLALMAQGPWKA